MTALKLDKSKLVKNLGSQFKLVPHLDKAIAQEDFAWQYRYEPKEKDDAFHPSSDCTPPVAHLLKKAKGQATERSFSRKTSQVGNFWHSYLQELLKRMDFADEAAIERPGMRKWDSNGHPTDAKPAPYHWVRGFADVAPVTIPVHGEFLVDFKTMNNRDFAKQDPPDWAGDKWESQVNIYMDFFDYERAIVIGIQKDTPHDFKEFHYERNQPLIDEIYKRWHLVSHALIAEVELADDRDVSLPLKGPK